jgi:inorganic pyrophosphatase
MFDRDYKISVYIEIEKHTNVKYEYCNVSQKLVVDRILPYPYFYPQAYGFIPNTLAPDNDELDVLIITDKHLKNDDIYMVYIIGVLCMADEKGEDNKVLCVLEEDYEKIKDISDLDDKTQDDLIWFFSNYKSLSPGKWSKVTSLEDKDTAYEMYVDSLLEKRVERLL